MGRCVRNCVMWRPDPYFSYFSKNKYKIGIKFFGLINIIMGLYFFAELIINSRDLKNIHAFIATGIGPTAYFDLIGRFSVVVLLVPLVLFLSGIGIWNMKYWGAETFFIYFYVLCSLLLYCFIGTFFNIDENYKTIKIIALSLNIACCLPEIMYLMQPNVKKLFLK